jgi:hypothetical protein
MVLDSIFRTLSRPKLDAEFISTAVYVICAINLLFRTPEYQNMEWCFISIRKKEKRLYGAHAGNQLEHLPWKQVAELVKDSGASVPLSNLSAGHELVKTTVSDLLIWLTSSNING